MGAHPKLALASLAIGRERWQPRHVDDLECLVNRSGQEDLFDMLGRTLARRRINVAMSYVWDKPQVTDLIVAIDLAPNRLPSIELANAEQSMSRWLTLKNPMPLGVGVRLGKVFGMPVGLLCEAYCEIRPGGARRMIAV